MAPAVELAILLVIVLALIAMLMFLRTRRFRFQSTADSARAHINPGNPPAAPLISDALPAGAAHDAPVSLPAHSEEAHGPVVEIVQAPTGSRQQERQIADAREQGQRQSIAFEQRGKVADSPECQFIQLVPGDLKSVVVVPQALDNQWITDTLHRDMIRRGLSLHDPEMRKQREPLVRAEYLRSLVNADQIVVNRAFMYNNPAIYRDFVLETHDDDDVKDSAAFKALLERGDIIPYLLYEGTPTQPPEFDTLEFEAWKSLCQELRVRCIRLDWDEARNRHEINQWMTRRFHTLASTAYSHDTTKQVQDLGLDASAEAQLRRRLHDLAEWCIRVAGLKIDAGKEPLVTRNEVYGGYDLVKLNDGTYAKGPNYIPGFVVADGTNPSLGLYDADKLFGREIQRLMDLGYNSYLPDAIKGYPLTPTEALPRTALQELEQAARQPDTISGEQLLNLLQNAAFALTEQGLSLPFMGVLHLADVWQVRHMDEWLLYIQRVEELLRNPLQFADPDRGARAIYRAYFTLAQQIAGLVRGRYAGGATRLLAPWQPRIEFVLDIGLKTLTLHWNAAGVFFSTKLADKAVHGAVSVVGQLVVRGYSQARVGADLATSLVFMKRTLPDAQAGWEQIIDGLRRQGIQERSIDKVEEEGTMNYNQPPDAQD